MKHLTIPTTDLTPSQICLGTGQFGSGIKTPEANALLDAFVDLGGNFLDTANIYGDWIPNTKSLSEKVIGQWLHDRGNRSKIVLATKGGHPLLQSMNTYRLSRDNLKYDVDNSLGHLQTDTIDLYWLHRDNLKRPVGDILESLNEIAQSGKIRYFGCSNWKISRIQEAVDYAAQHHLHAFVANQPQWSLAVPNKSAFVYDDLEVLDPEGIEFHRKTGMAVIPYSSQGGGFFAKLDSIGLDHLREGDRKLYYNETNMRRFEKVKELAQRHSLSVTEIALSYLTSQTTPTFPIIGCRTTDQLRDSLKAIDWTLTPHEIAYLEHD